MSTLLPFPPHPSRTGVGGTRGRRRGNCGFVPPLKTGCHQAQLGMSLGHQHVYTKLSLVSRWERINPSPPRRYRIISFLNFVSLPYERRFFLSSLSLGSPPSPPPGSFTFPRCRYDYSRFTQLYTLPLMTSLVNSASPLQGGLRSTSMEKYIIYKFSRWVYSIPLAGQFEFETVWMKKNSTNSILEISCKNFDFDPIVFRSISLITRPSLPMQSYEFAINNLVR